MSQPLSSRLRTIAARVVVHPEQELDGRMLLDLAREVEVMEQEVTEFHDTAAEVLLSLNDALTGAQAILAKRNGAKPNNEVCREAASKSNSGKP